MQGGGHANASGAVLPRSVRNADEAVDYLKRLFSPAAPGNNAAFNSLEGAFAALEAKQ